MERILVTGGAGFIGSHLVDALISIGYRVRVLDSLAPPTHNGKLPKWFNRKAQFIRGDVREKKDWIRSLKGVDYVFHLAAYMDFHLNFSAYVDTIAKSTALLFEAIVEKKLPIKKIIAASSQAVYGEGKYQCSRHGIVYPELRPLSQLKKQQWEVRCPLDGRVMKPIAQKEDDFPNPQIPYGISKLALEKLLLTLGKAYNIPTVALRYSIVHGARQSFRHFYSGALREFAVLALSGQPMRMHEDSRQIRDFVHVDDVTRAHMLVLKNPKANWQVFNIGSGKPVQVYELAREVASAAGVKFGPQMQGIFRWGAPRHAPMDISKIKKLGWKPRKKLADNARDYVNWVQNYPTAKNFLKASFSKMRKEGILLATKVASK